MYKLRFCFFIQRAAIREPWPTLTASHTKFAATFNDRINASFIYFVNRKGHFMQVRMLQLMKSKEENLVMKKFKCRDTGKDCDWKITADNVAEILDQAILHGQQKHGSIDFSEDIISGMRAKIRDTQSPQIRCKDEPEPLP
jgi:predicted small metal-binding protein